MNRKDREKIKDMINRFEEKKDTIKKDSEYKEEFIVARRIVYEEVIKELKALRKELK